MYIHISLDIIAFCLLPGEMQTESPANTFYSYSWSTMKLDSRHFKGVEISCLKHFQCIYLSEYISLQFAGYEYSDVGVRIKCN